MLAEQNIAVDHLMKTIQAMQVQRTTGSLAIARGEGTSYELGTLVFINGQVVQSRVGRREGREALNWLLTWGKCQCTFMSTNASNAEQCSKQPFSKREPQEPRRISHVRLVPLEQAQRPHPDREESATGRLSEGKRRQFMQVGGKPLLKEVMLEGKRRQFMQVGGKACLRESMSEEKPKQFVQVRGKTWLRESRPEWKPKQFVQIGGKAWLGESRPEEKRKQFMQVGGRTWLGESRPEGKPKQFVQVGGKIWLRESRLVNETVLYRSKPLGYGLQVLSEEGLSRIHRHIFLLANGSRRVEDLMQLFRLNEHDMRALLYNLQCAGIISLMLKPLKAVS